MIRDSTMKEPRLECVSHVSETSGSDDYILRRDVRLEGSGEIFRT